MVSYVGQRSKLRGVSDQLKRLRQKALQKGGEVIKQTLIESSLFILHIPVLKLGVQRGYSVT